MSYDFFALVACGPFVSLYLRNERGKFPVLFKVHQTQNVQLWSNNQAGLAEEQQHL